MKKKNYTIISVYFDKIFDIYIYFDVWFNYLKTYIITYHAGFRLIRYKLIIIDKKIMPTCAGKTPNFILYCVISNVKIFFIFLKVIELHLFLL